MFPHTIHETLQSFSQVIKISNIAALMAVVVFVVKPAIFLKADPIRLWTYALEKCSCEMRAANNAQV